MLKKGLLFLLFCLVVLPACGLFSAQVQVRATPPFITPSQSLLTAAVELPTLSRTSTQAPATSIPNSTAILATAADAPLGQIARRRIRALSEQIGSRVTGLQNEASAAQTIEAAFKDFGYDTQMQPFSYTSGGEQGHSVNVIALKLGLSTKEIVVGAHYDSVSAGKGADDNASGVAVMLEAAERLKDVQTPYTIRFIAFGAEETGLNGSQFYVDQLSQAQIQNTVGMINLDSLIAGDITYVYGDKGPMGGIRDWILADAKRRGFEMQTNPGDNLNLPDGTPCDCSDYSTFEAAGIPFAYFEATNWNLGKQDGYTQVDSKYGVKGEIWHTQYDNLDYIDRTFPGRIDQHLNLFVTLLMDVLEQFKI